MRRATRWPGGYIEKDERESVRMARNTRVKYLLGANTEENSDVALRRASASVKFGRVRRRQRRLLLLLAKKGGKGSSWLFVRARTYGAAKLFPLCNATFLPFCLPLLSALPRFCTLSALFPTDSFSFFTVFCPRWKAHTFPSPPPPRSFFLLPSVYMYIFFSLSLSPRRLSFSGRRYNYGNTPRR